MAVMAAEFAVNMLSIKTLLLAMGGALWSFSVLAPFLALAAIPIGGIAFRSRFKTALIEHIENFASQIGMKVRSLEPEIEKTLARCCRV